MWWKNVLSSGIDKLEENPFTQEAFAVRFINTLCLLFTILVFFVFLYDLSILATGQPLSFTFLISYFGFDLLMMALFLGIFFLLRKTQNISLAASIFLVVIVFGGMLYLLLVSRQHPGNVLYIFCVPLIIFILKGSRSGAIWWFCFTAIAYFILKDIPLEFQYYVTYFDVSLIIFLYQRINEQYEHLAEQNAKKLNEYVTSEKELIRSKEVFLNIAAHKLRTPQTIMSGTIDEMLHNKKVVLPADVKKNLKIVERGSDRLHDLIEELLSVLAIDKGSLLMELEPLDALSIIHDVIKEVEADQRNHGVVISVNNSLAELPLLNLDKTHFRAIISHLLTNAVIYNHDNGSVTIGIAKHKDMVAIHIVDTGVGIPLDQHDKVFTKFYRAEDAILKDPNGSGLSLYIVKAFVESMNGTISFKSPIEKNGGTEFTLTFPIISK